MAVAILERVLCYIAALAFFYFAYRLIRRNRDKWLIGTSLILAFLSFLCSLTWFQGVFKTHIISVVYSTLDSYGKKLDDFQKTTARMQGELTDQQTKLENQQKQLGDHQKELDSVQGKIVKTQFQLSDSQTNIQDQYEKLFDLGKKLETAQTNLNEQEKKLEDVEYWVKNIFDHTTTESFEGTDTNRFVVFPERGFVLVKLDNVPVKNSVHGLRKTLGQGQYPLLPDFFQKQNLIGFKFENNWTNSWAKSHYTFEYVNDLRNTNRFHTVGYAGSNALRVDGELMNLTVE